MSSRSWNGGEVKWLSISLMPESKAVIASGWLSETVRLSSLVALAGPKACAAAICRVIAWIDDLVAGSAMRSLSVKSLIDATLGLRVLRYSGIEFSAPSDLISPLVLSHKVRNQGTPLDAKSSRPARMAPCVRPEPPNVCQFTLSSPSPAARACFSTSFCCSMIMYGR